MTTGAGTEASGTSGHNSVALLFVMLIGLLIIMSVIGYLCSSIARRGGLPKETWERCRDLAALCCCATVAVYLWGVLHVIFLEGENLFHECVDAGGMQRALQVDSYRGDYLPLGLTCQIDGGGSYAAAVPGYLNPTLASLAAVIAALGTTAALARQSSRSATQ